MANPNPTPNPTGLNPRERERFATKAREIALGFMDMAAALDADDAPKTAIAGLLTSLSSNALLKELRNALLDALDPEARMRMRFDADAFDPRDHPGGL